MGRFPRRRPRFPGFASDAFVVALFLSIAAAAFEVDPNGADKRLKQTLAGVTDAGRDPIPAPDISATSDGGPATTGERSGSRCDR